MPENGNKETMYGLEINPISAGRLIALLQGQDKDAVVIPYIANERGWAFGQFGDGDALIGKTEDGFVLLPIAIPENPDMEDWAK
jgi:hypothetical protein